MSNTPTICMVINIFAYYCFVRYIYVMSKNTVHYVSNNSPTSEFYDVMTKAFDHFNSELFGGHLPKCLITIQREKNTMGYFSPDRWGNSSGEKAHEIAVNPAYFANNKVIEIFQTIVHEQCHMWQHIYGKASRSGYHNKEWAKKMESIGLIPSHNGKKGGKTTGQKMSDYPSPDGKFIKSCKRLIDNGYMLIWVDRIPAISESAQLRVVGIHTPLTRAELILDTNVSNIIKNICPKRDLIRKKILKSKIKYHCQSCGSNTWGKPGLEIVCGKCSNFDGNQKIKFFN